VRDRPSVTAAWVAAWRSFGVLLPEEARLADDPYGARFARATGLFRTPALARALFPQRALVYMQVRTRVLDDALRGFMRDGGAQVVLLGAGFDCRALRFAHELEAKHATVFEVDHPATQARKREVLAGDVGAKTEYIAWNFEERDMSELPGALAERGHDASKPTLTIWEGVTMYLSENAIDASVRAMRDYSGPASRIAFTYVDRALIEHPTARVRIVQRLVAGVGEPFRFGWDPHDLPRWLSARGFEVKTDDSMRDLSIELLPERFVLHADDAGRRIATAVRT